MSHHFKVLTTFLFISIFTSGCATKEIRIHDINVSFNFDSERGLNKRVAGFRLYKQGKLVCETDNPKGERIECNIASPSGHFLFTMTAYFENGSESRHSSPFFYTIPE